MSNDYKYQPHTFIVMKGVGKQICKSCGLMALRNDITNWCINKGCYAEDHPEYQKTLIRLSKR